MECGPLVTSFFSALSATHSEHAGIRSPVFSFFSSEEVIHVLPLFRHTEHESAFFFFSLFGWKSNDECYERVFFFFPPSLLSSELSCSPFSRHHLGLFCLLFSFFPRFFPRGAKLGRSIFLGEISVRLRQSGN